MPSDPPDYVSVPNDVDKARYEKKIGLCGLDPFVLRKADSATCNARLNCLVFAMSNKLGCSSYLLLATSIGGKRAHTESVQISCFFCCFIRTFILSLSGVFACSAADTMSGVCWPLQLMGSVCC